MINKFTLIKPQSFLWALTGIVALVLIFSQKTQVRADIFRLNPAVAFGTVTTQTGAGTTDSKSLTMAYLDAESNLVFIRPGIAIGYGNNGEYRYTMLNPRIGAEFGLLDYKLRCSETYQIRIVNEANGETHTFSGFALGIGGEWKVSEMLTFEGEYYLPQSAAYFRNGDLNSSARPSLDYWKVGARLTPLPLVSITLDYRKSGADAGLGGDNYHVGLASYGLGVRVAL